MDTTQKVISEKSSMHGSLLYLEGAKRGRLLCVLHKSLVDYKDDIKRQLCDCCNNLNNIVTTHCRKEGCIWNTPPEDQGN